MLLRAIALLAILIPLPALACPGDCDGDGTVAVNELVLAVQVALGSAGDDDLFATGPGQTLIGSGGSDVFHLGTHTDAKVVVNPPLPFGGGITTVPTWAPEYTLPPGVDNLTAPGAYDHHLGGNGLANWIEGSPGNDVIEPIALNHFGVSDSSRGDMPSRSTVSALRKNSARTASA